MADGGDGEVETEMEAVRYTYPELQDGPGTASGERAAAPGAAAAACSISGRWLHIDLQPRAARQAFVRGRLALRLGGGYPGEPASPRLGEAKGLGDARQAAVLLALRCGRARVVAGGWSGWGKGVGEGGTAVGPGR